MSQTKKLGNTIKDLLENRLFFLILAAYLFLGIATRNADFDSEVNLSVNNTFDFGLWIALFAVFCPFIFLISYLIVQLLKRKTSYFFSGLHLAAIILTSVMSFYYYGNDSIVFILFVAQILLFVFNLLFVFGVLGKKKKATEY